MELTPHSPYFFQLGATTGNFSRSLRNILDRIDRFDYSQRDYWYSELAKKLEICHLDKGILEEMIINLKFFENTIAINTFKTMRESIPKEIFDRPQEMPEGVYHGILTVSFDYLLQDPPLHKKTAIREWIKTFNRIPQTTWDIEDPDSDPRKFTLFRRFALGSGFYTAGTREDPQRLAPECNDLYVTGGFGIQISCPSLYQAMVRHYLWQVINNRGHEGKKVFIIGRRCKPTYSKIEVNYDNQYLLQEPGLQIEGAIITKP